MIDQRRLLRVLRFGVIGIALAGMGFLVWRFELERLPSEGCSPLRDIEPGALLLIDMCPPRLYVGDAVLFRGAGPDLFLGAIAPPEGDPGAIEEGEIALPPYRVLTEVETCPGPDSRTLGAIPAERIVGRVLLALR